ncbi:MAG: elongation factor P [Terriglobales bacterium]
MVTASQLREGMAVRIEGQVYKVLECEVKAGGGQQGGTVKTRLRSTSSGRLWEPHFRPDERLEDLELERQNMEFLYADGDSCTFMNPDNFEQVELPRATLGPAERFLKEGMKLPVEFFDGQPISIVFPDTVEVRVSETAPPAHAGQDTTWKQATLENGMQINVPLFIAPGELIRVDTRTGRYMERVRLERKKGA